MMFNDPWIKFSERKPKDGMWIVVRHVKDDGTICYVEEQVDSSKIRISSGNSTHWISSPGKTCWHCGAIQDG